MKRKELFQSLLGITAFILILGYAGSFEHAEQVIYNMSQPTYDAIVEKLGEDASQKEIVREYTENKEFYDTYY